MRRSMLRTMLVILTVGLCTGPGSPAQAASKVYLMRGLADVSTGLDVLAAKLKRRGIAAWVDSYTAEQAFAARAIRDYKTSGGPIIIIGHSLGADAAISMAETLRAAGVPVSLIVAFSPANSRAVPSNVERAVNYYQSNSIWNATYHPVRGFRGSVRNVNLANDPNIHHFNIEKTEHLHRATIATIQGLSDVGASTSPKDQGAKAALPPTEAPPHATASNPANK